MGLRAIYKNAEGGVSVVIPTEDFLSRFSMLDIARAVVPAGVPFKIVDVEDLPLHRDENGEPIRDENGFAKQDRTFRDAWEVDESTLTDGVGSEINDVLLLGGA